MHREFQIKRQSQEGLVQKTFTFVIHDKRPVYKCYVENQRKSKDYNWETKRCVEINEDTIEHAPLSEDVKIEAEQNAKEMHKKYIKQELTEIKLSRIPVFLLWIAPPAFAATFMHIGLGESNPYGLFGLWLLLQVYGIIYHMLAKVAEERKKEINEKNKQLEDDLADLKYEW